ncbi:MAG: 3-dehydroquinate synthase [Dehalococcoidia bacterium]|nr:3-dehydroquinate synthase [Dehalococcoidia bacterium]
MRNLILTGFSGTGKSTVARLAARMLGWDFVDTDAEVVKRVGKSVEAIFTDEGEEAFRPLERDAIAQACIRQNVVISTGGGTFVQETNRQLMLRSGIVICLEANPQTIAKRLFEAATAMELETRPLLAGDESSRLERIQQLKTRRQNAYAQAHWTINTELLTAEEVAAEAVRVWDTLSKKLAEDEQPQQTDVAAIVHTSVGACPIYLGWGLLGQLGIRAKAAGLTTTAFLLTDSHLANLHAKNVQASLEDVGIRVHTMSIPAGEQSKSLEQAEKCYAWLAKNRAERGDFMVAVGGGVVGDLTGFVAATYARGIAFIQVPTSLAAMVDASVGGKTAVDLPAGKNLVGAFHQPRFVLEDVQALTTLPNRELTSGWAEAIKHGLIMDESLVRTFEEQSETILHLDPLTVTPALGRSVAIKARTVTEDERETHGIRTLLNYGHTLGHALEAATGYGAFLHGEAVGIGMNAAGIISNRMGLLASADLERQTRLLKRYGLRLDVKGMKVDMDAAWDAMFLDKKVAGGKLRWVLLDKIGHAVVRPDVPADLVREVIKSLT